MTYEYWAEFFLTGLACPLAGHGDISCIFPAVAIARVRLLEQTGHALVHQGRSRNSSLSKGRTEQRSKDWYESHEWLGKDF